MIRLSFRRPTLGHLLLAVLCLTAISQLAVGWLLYERLQAQLEADLGHRLEHVAALLTYSIDAQLVAQFREGDETLPAYLLVRRRLTALAEAAGVSRAYVFDSGSRTLVDTGEGLPGRVRHRLLAQGPELANAFGGARVATRLYADEAGRLRLSAFAPLWGRDGRVLALVGVEAPPAFFSVLGAVRREMLLLGAAGVGLAALAGILVIRQVEARLGRLRQMATRAAHGDERLAVQRHGSDQIGALGRDLDQLIAAIVAAREYQEAVLGSVDVGILTCDGPGHLTLANPRVREMLGWDGEGPVGRDLRELLQGEDALLSFVGLTERSEDPLSAEIRLAGGLSAGGRVLAASGSRLVQDGRRGGLVVSLLDVTELRRVERRARDNERLAALGRMAGGLLHELGNPLAALTMYLDLLRPLAPLGEGQDLLERAVREDTRLSEFLEDFRVFAGLAPLRRERVDLSALAEEAAGALSWPAGVARTLRGDGRAEGDMRLLAHAARNLLRNAIEALPNGGHIWVDMACEVGEARLNVVDDGPGLTGEQIESILEPFHTTKSQGSGLGLLIARRVAELHGGRLEVRGRPGAGAEFTLRWPASPSVTG